MQSLIAVCRKFLLSDSKENLTVSLMTRQIVFYLCQERCQMRPDHSMFWQVRVCLEQSCRIIASVDKDVKESHDKFDEWQIPSIAFLCFNAATMSFGFPQSKRAHFVHIHTPGILPHAIRDDTIELAGKFTGDPCVRWPPCCQVHGKDFVAGVQKREVSSHICLRSGMRLNIGVFGSKEFRSLNGQIFTNINKLIPSRSSASRIPLGVFIGERDPSAQAPPWKRYSPRRSFRGRPAGAEFHFYGPAISGSNCARWGCHTRVCLG